MRFCPVILVSLAVVIPSARAQVTVDLVLDQEQFLRDESLPVKVRITNRAGQTLHLGAEPDWLSFQLAKRDGTLLSPLSKLDVSGKFALEPSRIATRQVDLMPVYDLAPGRYFLTAMLKMHQWDQEVTSGRKVFEIIRGIKIWEEIVGIPSKAGPPEARRFALTQANYLRRPYLYVRLTDAEENRVYGVLPLGRLLSFGLPAAQIDRLSTLHVLFQTGPRAFTYCVISPKGQMIRRQRHDYYGSSRPILKSDGQGRIGVAGGVRRISRSDIPPPKEPKPNHEIAPPAP